MLPALILALAALGIALLRLWAYRTQLLEMARVLEETPPESNLRLTVRMSGTAPQRLEEGRQLRLETSRREQELKYTMACISHDIRTPLAGAMGYLQLLGEEPERQAEYQGIIRKRLEELEELLEELFLYTRLQSGSLPLKCGVIAALPPLWDALAEFYPQFEAAGVTPELRFDRFYQSNPARAKGGAGLGLSIVRELMERMGGQASAQITGDILEIKLSFRGA